MGCAQGKPSRGSPARSDGQRVDRLKRDNDYRPGSSVSRLSDPIPVAAAAAERAPAPLHKEHARRAAAPGAAVVPAGKTPDADAAAQQASSSAATSATPSPLPPHPPRRDDELVDGWPTWLLDNVPREVLQGIVPKSADAYDKIEKVGQGTYSNVYKARERGTGRIVALKKVRFDTSESESVRFMAREIRFLQLLDHPNVMKLEGIATSRMHRSIYLVFDFMYSDLGRLVLRSGQRLTEPQIKCYMQQLLAGLQHCHERGILHRDIKGSNLLIDRHGVLKIGDFGLANYYGAGRRQPLTSRVVTLWYRAPELLLGFTSYGVGIDLWSAGCLLAEMFFGKPLMPGSGEVDQLLKIFRLCGSPPDDYWRKMKLSPSFKPPKPYKATTAERFRDLPPSSLGLLATLLALDPAARGTAGQALQNSFFSTPPLPCDLSELPVVYKEEDDVDARKPRRQRSQRRKDGKQKAEEEQQSEINSGSPPEKQAQQPNQRRSLDITTRVNPGQEPVTNTGNPGQESAAANASSSAHDASSEKTIVSASSSTVANRFSASPVVQEASPVQTVAQDQKQLPTENTSHHSASDGDDHVNHHLVAAPDHGDGGEEEEEEAGGEPPSGIGSGGGSVNRVGPESRSAAFVSDFEAAAAVLRGSDEFPSSKQYVLVDHL
ncbi:probable serine/threonine-protein kinase At1g54610 [Miscanthus floridulus]|uniref:probable serine/threonine-protein kinase At1g54610 n=1 Tax=Miscanthus floridulus TaxID=154761 RepID=UPI003458E7F3